jgi:2-methylcitrate dehydratase
MRLSETQSRHALNLAGVANVALRQTRVGDLSMWKACAFSNAARNGVFAAMLAELGMTGPAPIFEGEKGFMKLVSGPLELAQLAGETDQRSAAGGQHAPAFKILDTYIKHYPVEYHAQTAVEAALELRAELVQVEGERAIQHLSEIEIGSYDVAIEIIGREPEKWQPTTRETADHSFPYCVAIALHDGRVTLQSFGPTQLRNPAVRELMKKVRVVREPAFVDRYPVAMPTRITVRTREGKTYTKQKDVPLGHPGNPMSDQALEGKFRRLVVRRLGQTRTERLIRLVWKMDTMKDISALMPLLRTNS